MSDPKDPKSRILARRAKFMMATFAATLSAACSSEATPAPCLDPLQDGGSDTADTGTPEPCLGTPYEDSGSPEVCLSAPLDSGPFADGDVDADAADAEPTPCLKVAPDSGFDGGAD